MPRKKKAALDAASIETIAASAVEEMLRKRAEAQADGPRDPNAKNWGDPYRALVTTPTFELGENRRFKQRVFIFKEKPSYGILASLKENGFTYRANEKAWTIQATPETRKLSDELARTWAGPNYTQSVVR